MPSRKLARRSYWLIAEHEISRLEVLTIGSGEDEALPVFSFEEEAQMFLYLRADSPAAQWKVRETSVGELASVLYGPCRGVKRVALDPLPGACGGALDSLLSVRREKFVRGLLGEDAATPRRTSAPAHGSASLVLA